MLGDRGNDIDYTNIVCRSLYGNLWYFLRKQMTGMDYSDEQVECFFCIITLFCQGTCSRNMSASRVRQRRVLLAGNWKLDLCCALYPGRSTVAPWYQNYAMKGEGLPHGGKLPHGKLIMMTDLTGQTAGENAALGCTESYLNSTASVWWWATDGDVTRSAWSWNLPYKVTGTSVKS